MVNGSAVGMRSHPIPQRALMEAIQREDSFVYALVTRENAVKIGITTNMAIRKKGIKFGGTERFVGYMPGGIQVERGLHRSLDMTCSRIPGTREYYYPMPEVLPVINEMRAWMGIRPMRRRDLPRPASCTFHSRVMEAETHGTSVFK